MASSCALQDPPVARLTRAVHSTAVLWNGVRVGLLILYDIELPETALALGQLVAELILVTNGNMDTYGPVHRTAIMARARKTRHLRCWSTGRQWRYRLGIRRLQRRCRPLRLGTLGSRPRRMPQLVSLDPDQLQPARHDYDDLNNRRLQLSGEQTEHVDGRRELLTPWK